jgi:dTDP-4-amino-4,6-dideoxygalactose transaminase
VATGYGRGALWLAVQVALEGKRGAQVLVPDFVCAQVPEAVRKAGGIAAFFPVQSDLTVREEDLEAAITPQTAAVILVHYYGRVLPGVERLAAVCRERGVVVIEDCALALGARAKGVPAGRFGDVAVFSFTKSDWCYGGGLVATSKGEWGRRLRALRDEGCHPAARLAFFYGLLRRADVAANHPGASRSAGGAGRWLEEGLAWLEPSLEGNFLDAGRFDARMPEFAARRALHILREVEATMARRRVKIPRLYAALRAQIPGAAEGLTLLPGCESLEAGDSGSFLLLCADDGDAAGWAERADAAGCTLRLSWPAYQRDGAAPRGEAAAWLGRHLLIIENPAA